MNLADFKTQYPAYKNVPDDELAQGLHKKYYSAMPYEEFTQKIGLTTAPAPDTALAAANTFGGGGDIEGGDGQKSGQFWDSVGTQIKRAPGALVEGTKDIARAAAGGQAARASQGAKEATAREDLGIPAWQAPSDAMGMPIAPGSSDFYNQAAGGAMAAAQAPAMQTAPEYQQSAGFLEDVIRTAPQYLAQVVATLAGGPQLGIAFMGDQIMGGQYLALRNQGVEHDRAMAASLLNAFTQAPLEQLALSKVLGPVQKGILGKIKSELGAVGSEFLTELVQQFPDAWTNLWAKNPDKTLTQLVRAAVNDLGKTTKEGAEQGGVAATLAAVTRAVTKIKVRGSKRASATSGRGATGTWEQEASQEAPGQAGKAFTGQAGPEVGPEPGPGTGPQSGPEPGSQAGPEPGPVGVPAEGAAPSSVATGAQPQGGQVAPATAQPQADYQRPREVANLDKLLLEQATKEAAAEEARATGKPLELGYQAPEPQQQQQQQGPGAATDTASIGSGVPPAASQAGAPSMVRGGPTRIFTAGSKEPYQGHYAFMELGDLKTSHDPSTFAKNPLYPEGVQERDYAGDKNEQMKVIQNGKALEPAFLLTNNPDAINGPTIVTPDGIALGGNSRGMSLARAYAAGGKGARAYRKGLEELAGFFGLDSKQVAGMRQPVLVRVVDAGAGDAQTLHRMATEFNQPPTQEMGSEARTASAGRNVSGETLESLGRKLADSEGTLRELLDKGPVGLSVLNHLVEDGVIAQTQLNRFWSQKHKKLNAEGKDLVERTILGSFISDAEVLSYAPDSALNKISAAIPPLSKLRAVEGADFSADLDPALRLIMWADSVRAKKTVDWEQAFSKQQTLGQGTEPPTYTPRQMALALALKDMGPNQFREAVKQYASDTAANMFGPGMPADEAFVKAFGAPPAWAGEAGPQPEAGGSFGFADMGGYADNPGSGAIKFTGEEIKISDERGKTIKAVMDFARKHGFFKKPVKNQDKGISVAITSTGLRASVYHNPKNAYLISKLPELIAKSKFSFSEPPKPGSSRDLEEFLHFRVENVEVGGRKIIVGLGIKKFTDGHHHYNVYEVKEGRGKGRGPSRRGEVLPESEALAGPVTAEPSMDTVEPPNPDVKPPSGHADMGGYSGGDPAGGPGAEAEVSALEGPELVELATSLLGRAPKIMQQLRQRAHGMFKPGKGIIELQAKIFEDPANALKTLAHEIGHAVDWLPDKFMNRGNILGRIASLKRFMKGYMADTEGGVADPLTPKDKARLEKEARELSKEPTEVWIDEEITRTIDITPEQVLAIWKDAEGRIQKESPELYRYVAGLNTREKKSIVKEAMRGVVREDLKRFASTITEKTGRKIKELRLTEPQSAQERAEFAEKVRAKYQELILEELRKRRTFSNQVIRDELRALTREWKPFDPEANPKVTKYRYSSPELYADAISVLLNQPNLLQQKAPEFYRGFFNYLGRKPRVKAVYDDIQGRLNDPDAIMAARQAQEQAGFGAADKARLDAAKHEKLPLGQVAARELVDQHSQVLRRLRPVQDQISAENNPELLLEEMRYSGSQETAYLQNQQQAVLEPLEAAGITEQDFGSYLKLRRVVGERSKLANPGGETAKTAQDRLDWMRKKLGPEKWAAMEQAGQHMSVVRKQVVDFLSKAEMFSPELQDYIENNPNYAKFNVVGYLERKGVTASGGGLGYLKSQIGTLGRIENPLTATLLQDIALIRAANTKLAAKATTDMLNQFYRGEIKPSGRGQGGRFKGPAGADMGQIRFMHNGKVKSYDVPKYVADAFERNPEHAGLVTRLLVPINQFFRAAFVNRNPGWWLFNVPRDAMRAWKNLPSGFWKSSGLAGDYIKTAGDAWSAAFGVPSDHVNALLRKKVLLSDYDIRQGQDSETTELRRLMRRFNLERGNPRGQVRRALLAVWDAWGNVGAMTEIWSKLAGERWFQRNFPEMNQKELAHVIRTQIGSPDFKRQGAGHGFWNNLFLFFNAWKEGDRGDWEAIKNSPAAVAYKTSSLMVPKLLMYAAALGLLGAMSKEVMDSASDYDKTNYIVVPLFTIGEGNEKKGVYLRLPQDFIAQRLTGLLWLGLQTASYAAGKAPAPTSPGKVFDYGAGQAPNLTPGIGVMTNTIVPYLAGQNPYDSYRGKNVVPDRNFAAGGWASHKYVLAQIANQLGASSVKRINPDKVEGKQSALEKTLNLPLVATTLGRFLKVSNIGKRQAVSAVAGGADQSLAQRQVAMKEAIQDLASAHQGEVPRPEIGKLYRTAAKNKWLDPKTVSIGSFAHRVNRLASKSGNNPYLGQLHMLSSNEEKAAVLIYLQDQLSKKDYTDLIRQAKREKAISDNTMKKMAVMESSNP